MYVIAALCISVFAAVENINCDPSIHTGGAMTRAGGAVPQAQAQAPPQRSERPKPERPERQAPGSDRPSRSVEDQLPAATGRCLTSGQ